MPTRDPEGWNAFPAALVDLASWHADAGTVTGTSRDGDDDKFLALAVTGQADAIVSRDRRPGPTRLRITGPSAAQASRSSAFWPTNGTASRSKSKKKVEFGNLVTQRDRNH